MPNIVRLETPEVLDFEEFLRADWGPILGGSNYSVFLRALCFVLTSETFSPVDAVVASFEEWSNPHSEQLEIRTPAQLQEFIQDFFFYLRHNFPSQIASELEEHLKEARALNSLYWPGLQDILDYQNSQISEYRFDGTEPHGVRGWIWGFLFVVWNPDQKRCVVLHGTASD